MPRIITFPNKHLLIVARLGTAGSKWGCPKDAKDELRLPYLRYRLSPPGEMWDSLVCKWCKDLCSKGMIMIQSRFICWNWPNLCNQYNIIQLKNPWTDVKTVKLFRGSSNRTGLVSATTFKQPEPSVIANSQNTNSTQPQGAVVFGSHVFRWVRHL